MLMKIQRLWKRFAAVLPVWLLLCLSIPVQAADPIDVDRACSLTISIDDGDVLFPGVEFRVYRVASVSASGRYQLTGDFDDYPITLNGLDSSGLRRLAQTLDGYIVRDGLQPVKTRVSGDDGRAVFTELETGLYLFTGSRFVDGPYTYDIEPQLVYLPAQDQENGQWVYDAALSCKYDRIYQMEDTVERKVLKVWKDDGFENKRPDEIQVQLLRDDVVYDTVTLNESNQWRYTWTGLDSSHQWRLTEVNGSSRYQVTVEREGITFVLTNTFRPSKDNPDNPGSDTPTNPGTPVTTVSSVLPQTGMLWWPLPLLACGGLILFFAGWKRWRRHES